jgi:hypothetical protein
VKGKSAPEIVLPLRRSAGLNFRDSLSVQEPSRRADGPVILDSRGWTLTVLPGRVLAAPHRSRTRRSVDRRPGTDRSARREPPIRTPSPRSGSCQIEHDLPLVVPVRLHAGGGVATTSHYRAHVGASRTYAISGGRRGLANERPIGRSDVSGLMLLASLPESERTIDVCSNVCRWPHQRASSLVIMGGDGEGACKRDSVDALASGGHPSVRPTRGCPWRTTSGRAAQTLCSALLRVGFTKPTTSPSPLVRSYRTVSALPVTGRPVHRRSLSVARPSGHPDLALASTLPGGVPTFLDVIRRSSPRPPGPLTIDPKSTFSVTRSEKVGGGQQVGSSSL